MKLVNFLKFFFKGEIVLLKTPCKRKKNINSKLVLKDGFYIIKIETVEDFLKNKENEYDKYLECNVLPEGTVSVLDNTYGCCLEVSIDYKIEVE